jgi:DNA-directed RNA polymerase specialized sigma24 family protein
MVTTLTSLMGLPRSYRLALALRDLGADDQLIADCLEIERSAVSILVELGHRKLRQFESDPPS